MPGPLVSVLILNYNYGTYLAEAIESVTRQTYDHLQIVVRDDGSTDDSWATIERLAAADRRIEAHRNERNLGMDATVRRLFADARGDYIGILASDDRYAPDHVAEALRLYRRHPELDFIYRGYFVMDGAGRPYHLADPGGLELSRSPYVEHFAGRDEFLTLWIHGAYVNFSTALIPRRLVDELGPYGAEGIMMGDYELAMRWAAAGKRMGYWATPVAFNRRHGTQFSAGIGRERYGDELLLLGERYLTAEHAAQIRLQPEAIKNHLAWATDGANATGERRARLDALLARIDAIADDPAGRPPTAVEDRRPAVSIILPALGNDLSLLGDALASIRAQTFEDFEVIVVGEGAPRLESIVAYHGLAERTRFLRHRVATSPGFARHHGIKVARGSIVAYCDEDNRLLPNHLADLVAAIRAGADIAAGTAVLQLETFDGPARRRHVLAEALIEPTGPGALSVSVADAIPLNAVAHRMRALDRVGPFDPGFGLHTDREFLARFRELRTAIVPRPVVEVTYRAGFGRHFFADEWSGYLRTLDAFYIKHEPATLGERDAHRQAVIAAANRRDGSPERDFELLLTLAGVPTGDGARVR